MRTFIWIFVSALLLAACGPSYEEKKRLSRQERARLAKENAAALKIAVMPTLDCLPLYVARHHGLFASLGADIRLKPFTAQMDCDTALAGGSVEGAVTDLVRGQRTISLGTPLTYIAATETCWQLIGNRNARIRELKQLNDKMVAMTRYSATDMLAEMAVDSGRIEPEMVFRIQVNDVGVRLHMLENNEMDALLLPEPQATAARLQKHNVLMDSRKTGLRLGALAMRTKAAQDTARRKQMEVLVKAYDMACDSINKHGLKAYSNLIASCCGVSEKTAAALPKMRFSHAAKPRTEDVERAAKWLAGKLENDRTIRRNDGIK